jgi:hypothetical protein
MSQAPPPPPRRLAHRRRIVCEVFERDDGLLDLEGTLLDTQTEPVRLATGRIVEAGEAIHRMRVRLTVDRERRIVAAAAYSEAHPYPACEGAEAAYPRLVGLRIGPGFTRAARERVRGEAGCTHLTELIPVMATTLFQVLWADGSYARASDPSVPSPLGACHGLRGDGEVVRLYFPQFRQGDAS